MTTFQIKLLAAILMVVDHVGAVLFPDILVLRYVGRLSFPLFAWLIGQGEKYTKNFNVYFSRLIIWGLLSQPIHHLLFPTPRINILPTLALGLLAIKLDKLTRLTFFFACIFAVLAQFGGASYGAYGVFAIVLLSKFNFDSVAWWAIWILLNFWGIFMFSSYQFLAVLAPLIFILWNGKQGQKAKWFYTFYPLHLGLILLVSLYLKK